MELHAGVRCHRRVHRVLRVRLEEAAAAAQLLLRRLLVLRLHRQRRRQAVVRWRHLALHLLRASMFQVRSSEAE